MCKSLVCFSAPHPHFRLVHPHFVCSGDGTGKEQKKVVPFERGALALRHVINPALVMALRS